MIKGADHSTRCDADVSCYFTTKRNLCLNISSSCQP